MKKILRAIDTLFTTAPITLAIAMFILHLL